MAAARDERDVVAGLREPRAEVAADAAGAHHRDAHQVSSVTPQSLVRRKRRASEQMCHEALQ